MVYFESDSVCLVNEQDITVKVVPGDFWDTLIELQKQLNPIARTTAYRLIKGLTGLSWKDSIELTKILWNKIEFKGEEKDHLKDEREFWKNVRETKLKHQDSEHHF